MARWEDTALSMPKITKDPIVALIESQSDEVTDIIQPPVTEEDYDEPEDYDSVYGDQEEAIGQDMPTTGSLDNPIELDDEILPGLGDYDTPTAPIKDEEEYESNGSSNSSMVDKLRSLEEENALLLASNRRLEDRIDELENMYGVTISGVSNHTRTSRDYGKLTATVSIDGREVLINNLSPRMSGWDFTRKVAEAVGKNPGNMIIMQHTPIQLDLPLEQHGLGLRPFYAISLGQRQIERGQSIKVELMGRGPLI